MKSEPYLPLSEYADALFVRSLLTGPVVQFAGHTSGHSAYFAFRADRPEIVTRSNAEPTTQPLGFWIVFGEGYKALTVNS